MCGISAIAHTIVDINYKKECKCMTELTTNQTDLLQKRGPDTFGSLTTRIEGELSEVKFYSTVLHQRGEHVTSQPLRNSLGNVLLWNGEVFGGLDLFGTENDGEKLLHLLSLTSGPENMFAFLSKIQGPWAFIYWESLSKCLWFGRDLLGRRSLLWNRNYTHSCSLVKICSVADYDDDAWTEVPADGIYCLKLKGSKIQHYPWLHTPLGEKVGCEMGMDIDATFSNHWLHRPLNRDLPKTETIGDLYEIAWPENSERKRPLNLLADLKLSSVLREAVETFACEMEAAVKKRTDSQPQLCKDCIKLFLQCGKVHSCKHSSVAILYSGGVDSIFLAALADRCVSKEKPIDLLNVSFEHKIKSCHKKGKPKREDITFESPDRVTGREGLKELTAISPSRIWNFVEIDVTADELRKKRTGRIQHLISPAKTVLDDSIGCAIWFAARGKGILTNASGFKTDYCSPARVVLVGMGADEQLAGYSRHRAKFSVSGWGGLTEEVAMEMDRISCRNLGRDDRIISDHGREARLPFLDENVVCYLKSLPMWLKANLSLPRGVGEKLILRLAAASLGLTNSAVLPKRAVQFGSRIARSENRKEKGSDLCSRLAKLST